MKKAFLPVTGVILSIMIAFFFIGCEGDGNSSSGGSTVRFTTIDLGGTWALHGVSTSLTRLTNKGGYHITQPGGDMVVLDSGNILSGALTIVGIVPGPNLSGSLTITESGFIDGTIATNRGFSFFIDSGLMDISKTSVVYIDTTNNAAMPVDFAILNKQGGNFLNTDIHGDWHMLGLCSRAALAADFGSIYGDLTINAVGAPSGTFNLAGTAHAITGGSFSLNAAGEIGVGDTLIAGLTWLVSSGKLDQSKTFGVFTSQTGASNDMDMVVIIKESSLVLGNSDLAGTWYIFGATAGEAGGDGTIVGTIILGSTGTVTGGSITLPGDSSRSIDSGDLSVTAAGSLTGSFTLSTTETITIAAGRGRMDQSRNKMAFVDGTNHRFYVLFK